MDVLFQVVLSCPSTDFQPIQEFLIECFGFKILCISPADAPQIVVLSGCGLNLCLERDDLAQNSQLVLRLPLKQQEILQKEPLLQKAPKSLKIRLIPTDQPLHIPPIIPEFLVTKRPASEDAWQIGRAAMQYRDLVPSRLGGAFIASHIRIPHGGPVPDYVHFHKVRFQMIFCKKGWVKVVYEDQGEPFLLEAGDCVLQPPEIRHRVLESSEGLEVIEVGCPAIHDTIADHQLALPTPQIIPGKLYGNQEFVRYRFNQATWVPEPGGWTTSDAGISRATRTLASVHLIQPGPNVSEGYTQLIPETIGFYFLFVLEGTCTFERRTGNGQENVVHQLGPDDCVCVPTNSQIQVSNPSPTLRLLEVAVQKS